MTDEMLELARENQRKAGIENVDFLKGEIEHPSPKYSVDVIISNCVINLSGDKDRVLREAFRVLKPGGRLAVCDVVTHGDVPAEIRETMLLWVGCIAGALRDQEHRDKLTRAGFGPTRIYAIEDAREILADKAWTWMPLRLRWKPSSSARSFAPRSPSPYRRVGHDMTAPSALAVEDAPDPRRR